MVANVSSARKNISKHAEYFHVDKKKLSVMWLILNQANGSFLQI